MSYCHDVQVAVAGNNVEELKRLAERRGCFMYFIKRFSVCFLALTVLFVLDCAIHSPVEQSDDGGSACFDIRAAQNSPFSKIADSAAVTISASDMNTITKELTVSGNSVTGMVYGIPAGNNRLFAVSVFDSLGILAYYGSVIGHVTADSTVTIEIIVTRVTGNVIINGIIQDSSNVIPGHELKVDETWSGELVLKGDIVIPTGITLTILPGTTIKIAKGIPDWDGGFSDSIVDFYSRGNIVAHGTKESIITLTVDSDNPARGDWWGIGLSSGSSMSVKYCCLAYASNMVFIFSTSASLPVIENCLFAYTDAITDFGPNSEFKYNSFINGLYGYTRFGKGKTGDISYSVFENNSMIDVETVDSNQTVSVSYSNFGPNCWYNLYISTAFSPGNVVMTADVCFGITKINDNGFGTITLTNPADTPIASAGCGFEMPKSVLKTSLILNTNDPERVEKLRYLNEKEKNFSW